MGAMTGRQEPTLVLWDIDRTLVEAPGIGWEIYEAAFERAIGLALRSRTPVAGRTERAILTDLLVQHGITDPEPHFDPIFSAMTAAAGALRERMRGVGRRLPGTAEAMAALDREGVTQTVVTGNIEPIAVIKLEVFELHELVDFEVGGYGGDHDARAALVDTAWRRAERKYGVRYRPERVVVVGETPYDVTGALDAGARPIGVATGEWTATDLRAAGAGQVFDDLADTAAVVAAVLDPPAVGPHRADPPGREPPAG